ncbi:hypothetical protein FRC07_008054 [Ceratobasidium sp. 392]|nr:hypothetical protein FRC07_008054 [Ceratobasidium sp. 392]
MSCAASVSTSERWGTTPLSLSYLKEVPDTLSISILDKKSLSWLIPPELVALHKKKISVQFPNKPFQECLAEAQVMTRQKDKAVCFVKPLVGEPNGLVLLNYDKVSKRWIPCNVAAQFIILLQETQIYLIDGNQIRQAQSSGASQRLSQSQRSVATQQSCTLSIATNPTLPQALEVGLGLDSNVPGPSGSKSLGRLDSEEHLQISLSQLSKTVWEICRLKSGLFDNQTWGVLYAQGLHSRWELLPTSEGQYGSFVSEFWKVIPPSLLQTATRQCELPTFDQIQLYREVGRALSKVDEQVTLDVSVSDLPVKVASDFQAFLAYLEM